MTRQSLPCPKFLSVCALLLAGFMSTPLWAAQSGVGSKAMYEWMKDFNIEFMAVDADHDGMIPPVLPSVFEFFDRCRQPINKSN